MKEKLFHKDFTLVVIGQIISLFGNAILRFALPLYLLDVTGSSSIFGIVMAISVVPMILLSPVGGMVADRVNRRNIMVVLDAITAGLVVVFGLLLNVADPAVLVAAILLFLSAIQAMYQPAVQASIPLLATKNNLTVANATVNQVNALSGLLGPVLGGILYGFWGLVPVVVVSAASFLLSSIMEIFIHIPFQRSAEKWKIGRIIRSDLRESLHFIVREKPQLLQVMFVVCLFNLVLSSMLMTAGPVIVKMVLQLPNPDQLYGLMEGFVAAGGILGGILTGVFAKKLRMSKAYLVLLAASAAILPAVLTMLLGLPDMAVYVVLTICGFLFSVCGTMFTVLALTLVQRETPDHLIGKVISYVLALCMCAQPIGYALYGFLFNAFPSGSAWILFTASAVSILISLLSRAAFRKLPD